MTASALILAALDAALQDAMPLQAKWVKVLHRLAAEYGAGQALRHFSDSRTDALVRAMDAETLSRLSRTPPPPFDLHLDLQGALSRYWVLSTYEMIRTAHETPSGRGNPKLTALRRRIEQVRVAIAKLEIANDAKLKDEVVLERYPPGNNPDPQPYSPGTFYPPMVICPATGSVGWWVIDSKTLETKMISRRMLSDECLALFD